MMLSRGVVSWSPGKLASFGAIAPAFLALLACSSRGTPCLGNTCGARSECVASVCSPSGRDPVPASSERIALEPVGFAVLGGEQERSSRLAILGSESAEGAALYVAFGDAWKSQGELVRAFLLLSIDGEATPEGIDVPLEAWTIAAPWPRARGRVNGPRLSAPSAHALARPGTRVRIDVTDLVRHFRSGRDEGIAVVAASNRGAGLAVTAVASASRDTLPSPLLEVYVARRGGRAAW
jgi:hypothetical protein